MRFSQLDRITALEPGRALSGVKCLSLSEEYLQDHFPRFPVMPGVLMLEAMFQASMWLVRVTEDFQRSTVVLREAKGVKFQGFVQPGNSLVILSELNKSNQNGEYHFKVSGKINDRTATSARLVVESYNLCDKLGLDSAIDDYRNHQFKLKFRQLCCQIETNLR